MRMLLNFGNRLGDIVHIATITQKHVLENPNCLVIAQAFANGTVYLGVIHSPFIDFAISGNLFLEMAKDVIAV